jgi:hypothetical protein
VITRLAGEYFAACERADQFKAELDALRAAVARLPDVCPEDVRPDSIPTFKLIDRIRDCRDLLP